MNNPASLAILRDFPEEQWPSMDLCADMLLREIGNLPNCSLRVQSVCPPFRSRFSRQGSGTGGGFARNADRLLNRLWDFPRYARQKIRPAFDLFHVVDHSYSQLVHELPAERTGVYCHDLDTFRCVLQPAVDPRPKWFRAMAGRILRGMQKAALVFYSNEAVRREIEQFHLIDPQRLVLAPLGVAPEFSPIDPGGPSDDPASLEPFLAKGEPFILHVGSNIQRKRIDILLEVFAALRSNHPELRLVQVGGPWTDAQREQFARLNLESAVTQIRGLERGTIARLFRRAALVLQPSEAEGFGLPVIEALACGATVVASDIPTLREAAGEGALFCKVADVADWVQTVDRVLSDSTHAPDREFRLAQAKKYSWPEHARIIADTYLRLATSSG